MCHSVVRHFMVPHFMVRLLLARGLDEVRVLLLADRRRALQVLPAARLDLCDSNDVHPYWRVFLMMCTHIRGVFNDVHPY